MNDTETLTRERRAALAGFKSLSAREVLERDELTTDEKIAVLREREQDVREQMVAEEESMGTEQALGDALREITAALETLGAERQPSPAPTKHG